VAQSTGQEKMDVATECEDFKIAVLMKWDEYKKHK
jgi:hypothetical protein